MTSLRATAVSATALLALSGCGSTYPAPPASLDEVKKLVPCSTSWQPDEHGARCGDMIIGYSATPFQDSNLEKLVAGHADSDYLVVGRTRQWFLLTQDFDLAAKFVQNRGAFLLRTAVPPTQDLGAR